MTAISDFVAHPRTWLNNNILRSLIPFYPITPTFAFKFNRHPYDGTDLRTGNAIPSYSLMPLTQQERITARSNPASKNVDYLEAYWCSYADNAQHSVFVDQAANFMFTVEMDGCTFGVGSATPTGGRRVAHINMRSQNNSHEKQSTVLTGQGLNQHTVVPDKYMKSSHVPNAVIGEIKATTLGIRNSANGGWNFYYQQIRLINNNNGAPVLVRLKHV